MKKKLLFIMGSLSNGGGERSLLNLLNLLDYSKYTVDLILLKERGLFLDQLPENVRLLSDLKQLHFLYDDSLKRAIDWRHPYLSFIHVFGTVFSKLVCSSGFHKGQYRWVHFYKKAIPELETEYDVAISYLEGETTFYLADKVRAKHKIAWIHNDYSNFKANVSMDREFFKKIDHIVSISETCVQILKDTFPDMQDKIVEIPNLTDSNWIRSLAAKDCPKECESDGLLLLSIGRLGEQKGFDFAIPAARILKQKGIAFRWLVIGEGYLREQLEKLRVENQVEDCFEFIGSRENPYAYMARADMIIQPSRYEGKSIVLDEAKILGVPIVATNYSTVRDQVSDGQEGIIVDMTPQAIADGIEAMISQKEKYREFLLSQEYGNQDQIYKYMELFDA